MKASRNNARDNLAVNRMRRRAPSASGWTSSITTVSRTRPAEPQAQNRQGEAGKALGTGVVFSFFGTILGIAVLVCAVLAFLIPKQILGRGDSVDEVAIHTPASHAVERGH